MSFSAGSCSWAERLSLFKRSLRISEAKACILRSPAVMAYVGISLAYKRDTGLCWLVNRQGCAVDYGLERMAFNDGGQLNDADWERLLLYDVVVVTERAPPPDKEAGVFEFSCLSADTVLRWEENSLPWRSRTNVGCPEFASLKGGKR